MIPARETPGPSDPRQGSGTLFVNGKEQPVPHPASVRGALVALGLQDRPVAVELNGKLVRRADQETSVLGPGDRMEVVSFVGGG